MSDNVSLGWNATIDPNPNGNWVRFSGSGSQSESGVGDGERTIRVDENTLAVRKEATVTVVQDESNLTTQFNIVQNKKCFTTVHIAGDQDKVIPSCGNSKEIVCDGRYSGFIIPARTFGPNCSASTKIVTAMVRSDMACSGGYVRVIAKQEANEQEYIGHNVTGQTSPESIVFPYEGGTIQVKATATRQRKYANCNCPQDSNTVQTGYTWTVQANTEDRDVTKETTFDELEEINGETGVTFHFSAIQLGPDCNGWLNQYEYNTDDTIEILSLYSGDTIIYATTANRNETVPDWLDGNVTFEFPYLQRFSYGACDCSDGCEWRASDTYGVITGEIEQGNTMFKCEGSIETNRFTHTFSFMGNTGSSNMGRRMETVDYASQPFTIRALDITQVTFNSRIGDNMEYSTDKGANWSKYVGQITLQKGYTAMFRCTSDAPIESVTDGIGSFSSTSSICVEGNIMSLIYSSDFVGKTTMKGIGTFCGLFADQENIITSHKLVMPATTLTESCYEHMFSGCNGMINCPEILPAQTVEFKSYNRMFQKCSNMTTYPVLSATKVMMWGCKQMFEGCKSFTDQIPDEYIYDVTEAKSGAFWSFFNACHNLTKGVKFPQLTIMPSDCFKCMYQTTKLTESPVFTIDKLSFGCYAQIFKGVSTLSKITVDNNFSDQSTSGALTNWVNGVSPNGVFVKPTDLSLPRGNDGIPDNWTEEPYS